MTPEQIFEIAHRYSDKAYPAPDDDSSRVTYWEFLEKDLIAFAHSIIEAEWESSDEPVCIEKIMQQWDYWREQIASGDQTSAPRDWFESIVSYIHPPPARKLTDEEIVEVVREASRGSALRRDGSTSLRIARAIERRISGEKE